MSTIVITRQPLDISQFLGLMRVNFFASAKVCLILTTFGKIVCSDLTGFVEADLPGAEAVSSGWPVHEIAKPGAICGTSLQTTTQSDFNLTHGFGSERTGTYSCTLAFVLLRKSEYHKDKHEVDKEVVVWRHRN